MKRDRRFSMIRSLVSVAATSLVTGALLSGVGCSGFGTTNESSDFQANYELEGFPYPGRFEFKSGYLFSPKRLQGNKFRPTWIGEYRGPGQPEDHVPFYIREMQARGWRLNELVAREAAGTKTLEFIKGDEGTRIELSRVYDGTVYGSADCALKAEVRILGLESFNIDENLALADRDGSDETDAEANDTPSTTDSRQDGAPGTGNDPRAPGVAATESRVVPTSGSLGSTEAGRAIGGAELPE